MTESLITVSTSIEIIDVGGEALEMKSRLPRVIGVGL